MKLVPFVARNGQAFVYINPDHIVSVTSLRGQGGVVIETTTGDELVSGTLDAVLKVLGVRDD